MKKFLFSILVFSSLNSFAQLYSPSASEVSMEEAQKVFNELKIENGRMGKHSECSDRAHMWSLRLDRLNNIKTEKVFLFFTSKFNMAKVVTTWYNAKIWWWFHVAPAVRVNGELVVMDATFNDKAQSVQEWAKSLMREPEDCIELRDSMLEYVSERSSNTPQQSCYYTSTPQYAYSPMNLGLGYVRGQLQYNEPTELPTEFTPHTLNWAVKSYQSKHRKEVRKTLNF